MPPKLPKKFEGEGNPTEATKLEGDLIVGTTLELKIYEPPPVHQVLVELTVAERDVLKKLLDRDRTSRQVHGGLKSLLALSDDEAQTLLTLLDRV